MVVIYRTKSARNADRAERYLIDHNDGFSKNKKGGGGGPKGEPPYFLYVVRG